MATQLGKRNIGYERKANFTIEDMLTNKHFQESQLIEKSDFQDLKTFELNESNENLA